MEALGFKDQFSFISLLVVCMCDVDMRRDIFQNHIIFKELTLANETLNIVKTSKWKIDSFDFWLTRGNKNIFCWTSQPAILLNNNVLSDQWDVTNDHVFFVQETVYFRLTVPTYSKLESFFHYGIHNLGKIHRKPRKYLPKPYTQTEHLVW